MVWPLFTNTYTYNDFGALSGLTDGYGTSYRFVYTPGGQLDSLFLGTGVTEKRSYDLDGRQIYKTRFSSATGIGTLVTDSLSYDKSGRMKRVLEAVRNQGTDQTLFSYDGLGAIVARESAIPSGSSDVEEFRNDAFGNVMRRLSQRSAGQINNAPYAMTYGIKGELTFQFAQLPTTPGIYQRQDDINQTFDGGRLMAQREFVRNPNDGNPDLQVAMRQFYGSDDRLMAVQRYSVRNTTSYGGTWEEYRYDALGRRVMTRVRRNADSPYSANAQLIPLCYNTSVPSACDSYIERVWWDGDQSLFEMRFADGASDVSNNGIMGSVHALALDEPLAVISHWEDKTRIINYNWRGQGLSSVFPDGSGSDATTNPVNGPVVDWPAATQAQTYFTPAFGTDTDNSPRLWLGTSVLSGKGTTGMLYRRNRYFDTNTGRFTQEDPIGIAGGLNAYGFGQGDPVNYQDPFGLCGICENVAALNIQVEGVEKRTGRDVAILGAAAITAAAGGAAIMAQTASTIALGSRVATATAAAGRIPNGDLERTFETGAGRIRILGEAISEGTTLRINDFLVYPDNASRLHAGFSAMRAGFRGLEQIARDAGYSQVIINYNRTSGINAGKIGQKIIDLITK
jgi:RHS repeat-associated protein